MRRRKKNSRILSLNGLAREGDAVSGGAHWITEERRGKTISRNAVPEGALALRNGKCERAKEGVFKGGGRRGLVFVRLRIPFGRS